MQTSADKLPEALCDLNGELVPLNKAKVSVLDRGFLFGDGIYEAIPVYGRRLFRFEEHMARLARNLAKVRIASPMSADAWLARLRRLVAAQAVDDQTLYVQVTRGVALRDPVMPPDLEPTVFIMSMPMRQVPAAQRHHGVSCVTARDFRWERGDLKCISLMGNVLARQIAADAGAAETILLRDGEAGGPWLTEASTCNAWIVHEGALLGPQMSEHLVEGIRVGLLRELCEEIGVPCNLRPISESDLRAADEILLTSSTREVLAVTQLDGEGVGHGALRGKPGPVYARLYEAYQRAKREQSI
jgi:D-alanine transaminase